MPLNKEIKPNQNFGIMLDSEYPLLSQKAVKMLLPLGTTYLCETAFLVLPIIMIKFRSGLVVQNESCVSLSKISPRIDNLCQAHTSH